MTMYIEIKYSLSNNIFNYNEQSWSVRLNSFEKILEVFEGLKSDDKISNATIDLCIKLHEERLCDPNIKVSNACITSLSKMMPAFKSRIKKRLDYLISPVLFSISFSMY